MKHLFDWSYDDLECEVRANLVYRAITRIDAGDVPDAKTILKIAGALGPEVIEAAAPTSGGRREACRGHARASISHIDTTVVETNVHYPTDSSLLQAGIRVLTPRCTARVSHWVTDAGAFVIADAGSVVSG